MRFEDIPKGRLSLQLRAFRQKFVAKRYLSRLSRDVAPLRIYTVEHKGSPLYRVRLGRFKDRDSADAALEKYIIAQSPKIKPIVVRAERH